MSFRQKVERVHLNHNSLCLICLLLTDPKWLLSMQPLSLSPPPVPLGSPPTPPPPPFISPFVSPVAVMILITSTTGTISTAGMCCLHYVMSNVGCNNKTIYHLLSRHSYCCYVCPAFPSHAAHMLYSLYFAFWLIWLKNCLRSFSADLLWGVFTTAVCYVCLCVSSLATTILNGLFWILVRKSLTATAVCQKLK